MSNMAAILYLLSNQVNLSKQANKKADLVIKMTG